MLATRRTRALLATAGAAALLVLTGCSSSSDGGGGSSASSDMEVAAGDSGSGGDVASVVDTGETGESGGQVEQQKVISTGNVQLRSDDVGQAVFDIHKVVDEYAGTIAEDHTETDKDGAPLRSRMVLRIPTADFDHAMTELEKVATLVSSKRQSADVTTQVLDVDARVEAQQRSIDRIQVLFDHATSIKDIVSIESELSRRQADLESMQAQQRYLADQTAQSTITVAVERTPTKTKPKPERHDAAGFLAGLSGGWGALKSFLVGVATVAGALLPWVLLALLLAIPGWPLLRRLRRRAPEPAAPTAPAA